MPIKLSGQLTISDIVAEFGGTAPYDIGDYYRGGGLVPNKNVNSNIPVAGSGQPIKFSQFYGATKIIELTYSLWGGGGAGGQGFENGVGEGQAGGGQDSVIMTKALYDSIIAQYGVLLTTIGLQVTISGSSIMPGILARSVGGFGGAHGAQQVLAGGDGTGNENGAGGSGGAVNSAAPAAPWLNWGVGGGGGGGDEGSESGWSFLNIIKYGSVDPWGQSGLGGGASNRVMGKIDVDVEVDYVLVAGRGGDSGSAVGNFNGAQGVPGVIEFRLDTTPNTSYSINSPGDGSVGTDRTKTIITVMRLDRAGVPTFSALPS